jgi:hypothetical protein
MNGVCSIQIQVVHPNFVTWRPSQSWVSWLPTGQRSRTSLPRAHPSPLNNRFPHSGSSGVVFFLVPTMDVSMYAHDIILCRARGRKGITKVQSKGGLVVSSTPIIVTVHIVVGRRPTIGSELRGHNIRRCRAFATSVCYCTAVKILHECSPPPNSHLRPSSWPPPTRLLLPNRQSKLLSGHCNARRI